MNVTAGLIAMQPQLPLSARRREDQRDPQSPARPQPVQSIQRFPKAFATVLVRSVLESRVAMQAQLLVSILHISKQQLAEVQIPVIIIDLLESHTKTIQ